MKRSRYDWILEIVTILCVIWSFYPLLFYNKLTNPMPIHYNALGEVDGWANPAFLFIMPLLALVFYIGLSIIEKYHPKFYYPVKVTASNANSLYKLALSLLRQTKFFLVLLFGYINETLLSLALSKGDGLNVYIVIIILVALTATLFISIIRMMRLKDI